MNIRLGVIEFNGKKMTLNDFVSNMTRLIRDDYTNYRVSIDEDANQYTVLYEGKTYIVKYGDNTFKRDCEDKDALNKLNLLVELSNTQNKIEKNEESSLSKEEYKKRKAFDNARKGILASNKDKREKMKSLIREDKQNRTKIIEETIKKFKSIYWGNQTDGWILLRFIADAGGVIGLLATIGYLLSDGIFLSIFFLICLWNTADGIIMILTASDKIDTDFRGLHAVVFATLLVPFIALVKSIKRVTEKIRLSYKLLKIKRTIVDVYKQDVPGKKEVKEKPMDLGIKEINLVIEMISRIGNETVKTEYTNKIIEIAKYYYDAIGKRNIDELHNIVLDQTKELKEEIDEVLKQESKSQYKIMGMDSSLTSEEYIPEKSASHK